MQGITPAPGTDILTVCDMILRMVSSGAKLMELRCRMMPSFREHTVMEKILFLCFLRRKMVWEKFWNFSWYTNGMAIYFVKIGMDIG